MNHFHRQTAIEQCSPTTCLFLSLLSPVVVWYLRFLLLVFNIHMMTQQKCVPFLFPKYKWSELVSNIHLQEMLSFFAGTLRQTGNLDWSGHGVSFIPSCSFLKRGYSSALLSWNWNIISVRPCYGWLSPK